MIDVDVNVPFMLSYYATKYSNYRQWIRIYDCTFSDNNFINRLRSVVAFKEGKRHSIEFFTIH